MGTTAIAQRVVLADGRSHRGALSSGAHHPCLGSQRGLPYSANRGEQPMNRIALDELKQRFRCWSIYKHTIGNRRNLSASAAFWDCVRCTPTTSLASWLTPTKTCSTATVVVAAAT